MAHVYTKPTYESIKSTYGFEAFITNWRIFQCIGWQYT
jgi:hypothetical protein